MTTYNMIPNHANIYNMATDYTTIYNMAIYYPTNIYWVINETIIPKKIITRYPNENIKSVITINKRRETHSMFDEPSVVFYYEDGKTVKVQKWHRQNELHRLGNKPAIIKYNANGDVTQKQYWKYGAFKKKENLDVSGDNKAKFNNKSSAKINSGNVTVDSNDEEIDWEIIDCSDDE